MAAVSLPSRVLGRKIKKFGAINFFVKIYFGESLGRAVPLAVPICRLPISDDVNTAPVCVFFYFSILFVLLYYLSVNNVAYIIMRKYVLASNSNPYCHYRQRSVSFALDVNE